MDFKLVKCILIIIVVYLTQSLGLLYVTRLSFLTLFSRKLVLFWLTEENSMMN